MATSSHSQPTVGLLETIRRAISRATWQPQVHSLDMASLWRPARVWNPSLALGYGSPAVGEGQGRVMVRLVSAPRAAVLAGHGAFAPGGWQLAGVVSRNLAALCAKTPVLFADALVARPFVANAWSMQAGGRPACRIMRQDLPSAGASVLAAGCLSEGCAQVANLAALSVDQPSVVQMQDNAALIPSVRRVPAQMVERIPIDRRSLPMPQTPLAKQGAFLKERQLLAQSAGGLPFTDIDLIGVYPKVPITAARRLEVEKGTDSLLLYLRPQAVWPPDNRDRPVVSVAIGRVVTDGRIVRAIIPEKDHV